MTNLTEEQALELKRLEENFQKKGEAFTKLDKELGETSGFANINSVPEYIKAKAELDNASNEFNAFKASLAAL